MKVLNKYFTSLSTIVSEFGQEKRKIKKGKKKARSKTKLSISKHILTLASALKSKYNTFDLPVDRDKMTKWIRGVLMASTINFVDSEPKVSRCNTSTVWSLLKQCSTETTHNAINAFENWFKASFKVPASSLVGLAAIITAMKLASVSLEMTEATDAYSKFKSVTQQECNPKQGDDPGGWWLSLPLPMPMHGCHCHCNCGCHCHLYHSRNYGRKFTMPEIWKLVSAVPDKKPESKDRNADLKARNAVRQVGRQFEKLAAAMATVGNGNRTDNLDDVAAFSGQRRQIICCKCGSNHP